ncbi:MAG: hypothetical protein ABSH16_14290, partial [Sedimentisphaerales bacterium]
VLEGDTPDTLAARVFEQECIAYPQAIQLFAEGRLTVKDAKVSIASQGAATEFFQPQRTQRPQR